MIIENENDQGVMQFKVDASGAWLNNSTFVLQKDNGGKMILDPQYGLLAGTGDLFTTEGTTVIPSFLDEDGDLILDEDGIPENANFFLDLRDGNAYFRGEVSAVSGSIGGWTIADDYLYSGSGTSFVALNGSKTENAAYAIWAGGEDPNTAPFWVKRNGDMYARDGTFRGTIYGSVYKDSSGNNMMNGSEQFLPDYLSLYGLEITNGSTTTFRVTANGQVYINGTVTMSAGSSINWANVTEQNVTQSEAYNKADSAEKIANGASSTASGASSTASSALNIANSAQSDANAAYGLASSANTTVRGWTYAGTTNINGSKIQTGTVEASYLRGGSVQLLSENRSVVGRIDITDTNDGDGIQISSLRGGMRLVSSGNFWIESNSGQFGVTMMQSTGTPRFACSENMTPLGDNGATLGMSAIRWADIFATNSSITSSDAMLKTDIVYGLDQFDALFDALRPASYKFIDGTSGRTHMGMIAQDVEAALSELGISTQQFAAFIKSPTEDEETGDAEFRYGLRYGEFIALIIYQVQKLKQELKSKVDELDERLSLLE